MAEGAGLLNRFTVKSRNGGSNPPLSANFQMKLFLLSLIFLAPMLADAHGALDERIKAVAAQIERATNNAQLYLQRGELHREHQDWNAAQSDYDRAEKLDVRLIRLNFFRARMFNDMGDATKGLGLLNNYLAANTNDSEALILRARLRAKLGEGQGAVADFSHAIQLSREPQPEIFLERAELQVIAGGMDEVLSGLDEGIVKLGSVMALQTRALDVELSRTNYDGALLRLARIMESSPRKEMWLARRGEILIQAGRVMEACKAFGDALSVIETLPLQLRESAAMQELHLQLKERLAVLDESLKITPMPAR